MNKKCQVFTPTVYAQFMINDLLKDSSLFGKKILENSCGEGNILLEIARKYIEDALENNTALDTIKNGLEKDIVAYEIDKEIVTKCIEQLNQFVAKYSIFGVRWDIRNEDFLFSTCDEKYDYIIGNPPYIKYSDLDLETRTNVKNAFNSCKKGKFDYCYPFIEKSYLSLNKSGKMSYLIPNSIFKNVHANELRNIIKKDVFRIYDYKSNKVFSKALTSSAIICIEKNSLGETLQYHNMVSNEDIIIKKINLGDKWVFNNNLKNEKKHLFGDYYQASITVATLLNKAFVLETIGNIEKEVVREAASPKNLIKNKKEYIIFPYLCAADNTINRIDEIDFKDKYPFAYNHLKKFDSEMARRNADKNCKFHEYGRSQALRHINEPKLVLSTVITNNVKVFKVSAATIPYSGIYIIQKNELYDLDFAIDILTSKEFIDYVKDIGINASGGSLRITVRDINGFDITPFIISNQKRVD